MDRDYLLKIFDFSRINKIIIQVFTDMILIVVSFFLSLSIRLNNFEVIKEIDNWKMLSFLVPITILIYFQFGFYQSIIRFISERILITAGFAIFLSSFILFLGAVAFGFFLPKSIPFIYFNFLLISTISIR